MLNPGAGLPGVVGALLPDGLPVPHSWPPAEWVSGTEQAAAIDAVLCPQCGMGKSFIDSGHGVVWWLPWPPPERMPGTEQVAAIDAVLCPQCGMGKSFIDSGRGVVWLHSWPPPEWVSGTEQAAAIDAVLAAWCHGSRRGAAPMATA